MGSIPPVRSVTMRHHGAPMRTYRAVLDEARDAQRDGRSTDIAGMDAAASAALEWLDSVVLDATFSRIRRW